MFTIDLISLFYLACIVVIVIIIIYYWNKIKAWFKSFDPTSDAKAAVGKVTKGASFLDNLYTGTLGNIVDKIPGSKYVPNFLKSRLAATILPQYGIVEFVKGVASGDIKAALGNIARGKLPLFPGGISMTPDGLLRSKAGSPLGLLKGNGIYNAAGKLVGLVSPSGLVKVTSIAPAALRSIPGVNTLLPGGMVAIGGIVRTPAGVVVGAYDVARNIISDTAGKPIAAIANGAMTIYETATGPIRQLPGGNLVTAPVDLVANTASNIIDSIV